MLSAVRDDKTSTSALHSTQSDGPGLRWIAFGFITLGAIGFLFDYRAHKNPYPLALLALGAVLLYVGRYVLLSTRGSWPIWGTGALLIVIAVLYNKSLFRKPKIQTHTQQIAR